MTETLTIDGKHIAFDRTGTGPLVVLAHGIGDTRRSYRFLAPALVDAGYQVANVDIRGCGESDLGWTGYSRTDIATDLVAVASAIGGPAVVIGQSISGGAATIAAASAPQLITGLVELCPFTRTTTVSVGALLRNRRHRTGTARIGRTLATGSRSSWLKYLDLAYPTKPSDWEQELAALDASLSRPGRMKVVQAMLKTKPSDAGAQLPNVRCPVLVVEGQLDPDFPDPRRDGEAVLKELPAGLGELVVLPGVGHYPQAQAPQDVLAAVRPFLAKTLPQR